MNLSKWPRGKPREDWNEGTTQPAQPGRYYRKIGYDSCPAYWNGTAWHSVTLRKGQEPVIAKTPHPNQTARWR